MRRWSAILCLLAAAGLASGCFVIDEINAGQEIMDQHRPHGKKAEEDAAKTGSPEDSSPGLVARVKDWWDGLGPESGGATPRDSGPPPHPDNVLGRCDLGGSLTFMRKFDCQRKGGSFKPRRKSGS
jgi:hypothetical protein